MFCGVDLAAKQGDPGAVPLRLGDQRDGIVRRAESLQQTADAQTPKASLSPALAEKLGVTDGATVRVTQGKGSVLLRAAVDASLPAQVVRVAAAHASTSALGAMFGAISVETA